MMTKAEKRTFLRDLTRNVLKEALEKVPNMPESWGGVELRLFLAEKFQDASFPCFRVDAGYRRQRRDYKNEMLVRNL